jgi:hypothetical protein
LFPSPAEDYDEAVRVLGKESTVEVRRVARIAAALAGIVAASCSRSITSSFSLLDPEWPRTASPTIVISTAGVSPDLLHLNAPVTVTITNNDGAAHRLDPAPELGYGSCSEMEQLGTLQPGQSGKVTIQRAEVICTFHDSAAPSNQSFQGFIVVH